jgi:hypothetical protein
MAYALVIKESSNHRFVFVPQEDESRAIEIEAWCKQEFGENLDGSRWAGSYFFCIRNERDAMHFKMRWC